MTEMSKGRTIIMALFIGLGYIVWGLLISLQPPFYPSEAEKKGATPSQYGFVFGIANMAAFIFAPIFGRYGAQIGPKLLYNTGAFVQAIAGISFGCLDYIDDNLGAFLGLSYFLRFLGGVADAAALGAVISILMKLFPKYVTTIVSWTEMLFGLGYMLGPALGSALYNLDGFSLPFFSVGSVALVVAIVLLVIVPNVTTDAKHKNDGGKSLTFSALFRSPSICLPFLDNFILFCGNGMIESMLEPHLKSLGASQMEVGITFLIMGGVYMVTTPVVGYICDKIRYPTIFSVLGNILMITAFLLVGPVPFIPLEPSTPVIRGALGICGLGYGMVLVSTFGRSQGAAIRKGYNDDMDTYLIISGMWSSSFYFGNFIGPTIAGIMVESVGFGKTTILFFSLYVLMAIVDICELAYYIKFLKKPGYIDLEVNQEKTDNKSVVEIPA